MKSNIIIIAPDPITQNRLSGHFEDSGFKPVVIERTRVVPQQQLIITQDAVKYCGEDLLQNTAAAIVLDSGYMWPQPAAVPTEEQWSRYAGNLDEYLRNEREAASFWYSFLEILNDCLPVCINPQEAYTTEAFKPWALEALSHRGIPTASFIAGNNRQKIAEFLEQNPGQVLSLPVSSDQGSRWVSAKDIVSREGPVYLQAFSTKLSASVLAVNGKAIHVEPERFDIDEIAHQISEIQSAVNMPLAELVFRRSDQLVLSDFRVSPDLNKYADETFSRALNEVLGVIKKAGK